jgi:uncharacterized membrane protein
VAEISAGVLELVGILIIIVGSCLALIRIVRNLMKKRPLNVVASLGRALALALEFKMGAEIIRTVIIHDLEELAVLGAVIIIRALLSVIIHYEIHLEEKSKLALKKRDPEKE